MPKRPKKPSLFPETRWSLVGRAVAPDDAVRQAALTELLIAYRPGLPGHAVPFHSIGFERSGPARA